MFLVQKIDYFKIHKWDGGSHMIPVMNVGIMKLPENYEKQQGLDFVKTTLLLYDTYEQYLMDEKGRLKQKALSKLTQEEKEALGL